MQKYKLISATSNATGRPAVGTSGRLVGQTVESNGVTDIQTGKGLVIWTTDATGDGIHTSKVLDVEWEGKRRQVTVTTLNTTYVLEETA